MMTFIREITFHTILGFVSLFFSIILFAICGLVIVFGGLVMSDRMTPRQQAASSFVSNR